ncbi:uncharacterized protein F5Z01DRAFT_673834 [Emericellopsis atlantica]|uniref:Ataxin-10 homolog n=1 Tax=Emericellopsis atlantica TaxID=2614577 RepID=A0A9P7ZMZ6_9HYPO|nr:uncharacterized protein F5Z01DRAFT_673834 [Emericellopsis atlantica]KAG9254687.1 hypothetical protein F5Z01DRAFT_673834 [Emericellopsis atlantica]
MDPEHAVTRLPEFGAVPPLGTSGQDAANSGETIEERCFHAALICLEGHYVQAPAMGPQTTARVNSLVGKALEKTHTCRKSREALARNVPIWILLTKIFASAIPSLTTRSVGPLASLSDPDKGVTPQESTQFIVKNHASIKEDLTMLIKLMHIARNLLVNADPQVPQDICGAVRFDQMVYKTIVLCVNVTSKGYDGEILDDSQRQKLTDITEHYKKLLVTSLQQAHNWTAKHDRNKMAFWFRVLFDDDSPYAESDDGLNDGTGFRPEVARSQVQNWLDRNTEMCETAWDLLGNHFLDDNGELKSPDNVPATLRPPTKALTTGSQTDEKFSPVWNPEETDRLEQDRQYGRVSREIDTWWLKARDMNYEQYVIPMTSIDVAKARLEHCKENLVHRYANSYHEDESPGSVVAEADYSDHEARADCHTCHSHDELEDDEECDHSHDDDSDPDHDEHHPDCVHHHGHPDHHHSHDHDHDHHHHHHHHHHPHHHHHHHHHHHDDPDYATEYVEDMMDEEEDDDDMSYAEGPLTGLLTEIPNILDPKQIEALHMIVKSCILDNAGSGLTEAGENLQKTRCRMFLALDCGKNLLRELLVFIAVWEKDEASLIFQVTTQIVEAIHHSALIPYAWNVLKIPKDIISPGQTVLLRLINHMFRARVNSPAAQAPKDPESKDVKVVHYLFSVFRARLVPECAALMHLQAEIRQGKCDAGEFPVDSWDMDRAKDGLAQYLDFLTTVAEMQDTREELIEWDAVYDLLVILKGLEAAVPKKPLVELPKKHAAAAGGDPMVERPYAQPDVRSPSPPPPPLQEAAHQFSWKGIKGQIFTILATLLQPPVGLSSPGNPKVQLQIVDRDGLVPLLNSCAYDDNNPFAKERVTLCLKWLLDGCEKANAFIRELNSSAPPPNLRPSPGGAVTGTLRVDGILGDVPVQVRSNPPPPVFEPESMRQANELVKRTAGLDINRSIKTLEEDFMAAVAHVRSGHAVFHQGPPSPPLWTAPQAKPPVLSPESIGHLRDQAERAMVNPRSGKGRRCPATTLTLYGGSGCTQSPQSHSKETT